MQSQSKTKGIKVVPVPAIAPEIDMGDILVTGLAILIFEWALLYPLCSVVSGTAYALYRPIQVRYFFLIAFVLLFVVFLAIRSSEDVRTKQS